MLNSFATATLPDLDLESLILTQLATEASSKEVFDMLLAYAPPHELLKALRAKAALSPVEMGTLLAPYREHLLEDLPQLQALTTFYRSLDLNPLMIFLGGHSLEAPSSPFFLTSRQIGFEATLDLSEDWFFTIGGGTGRDGCSATISLPNASVLEGAIHLAADLVIRDCPFLEEIRSDLEANGVLNFRGCPELCRISGRLSPSHYIVVEDSWLFPSDDELILGRGAWVDRPRPSYRGGRRRPHA